MDGVILYQVSSLQVVEGGPVITYGNIVREKDERKTRIAQYWTRRSDSFLEQRRAELHSALAGRWMTELKKYLPAADFADTADLPENHAHHQIQDELMQECEDIKRQLPISSFLRPAWDLETLSRIGVEEFSFDLGISKRIYTEKDEFYNPTPMFLIFAKKQR